MDVSSGDGGRWVTVAYRWRLLASIKEVDAN
jgi:hypothetical protein